ncbi:hypothetical protein, partial [Pseudomonas viridiflava]|uniref:hypothetical protein n=1 Tax=Pseudomonas viridiflava TaxID=33069 RepID=UPI0019D0C8DB
MRWLRIAKGLTVGLLTLLFVLSSHAQPSAGWSTLLDTQANLQLSDVRSARYQNQLSPTDLD